MENLQVAAIVYQLALPASSKFQSASKGSPAQESSNPDEDRPKSSKTFITNNHYY